MPGTSCTSSKGEDIADLEAQCAHWLRGRNSEGMSGKEKILAIVVLESEFSKSPFYL